jgi:hypothetical protein
MLASNGCGVKALLRLWRWTKLQVVQDIPVNDALCEFGCRKTRCSAGEWSGCENRLESIRLSQSGN